jgi:predicted house-cleaning noncanonical NTP pyrophosphatase (MazG superfamily)
LTIDERLEALAIHLEVLTRVHEDFERKTDKRHEELVEFVRQMKSYAADVKDAIARLANIAAAHDEKLDDHRAPRWRPGR